MKQSHGIRVEQIKTGYRVPQFFHDILGETVGLGELIGIAASIVTVSAMLWHYGLSGIVALGGFGWQDLVALLLTIDIVAGAFANLTAGTTAYYAARPVNRIIFIAVHIQPLLLFWLWGDALNGSSFFSAGGVITVFWSYTAISALAVNALKDRRTQQLLAGCATILGISGLALLPSTLPAVIEQILAIYLFKVVYAFAVNHELQPLHPRRHLAKSVLTPAFEQDPLFAVLEAEGWKSLSMTRLMLFKAQILGERQFVATDASGAVIGMGSLEVRKHRGLEALRYLNPIFLLGAMALLVTTCIPFKAFKRLNQYMLATEALRPKGPHGYVVFIGVQPEWQGRGIGKALLEAMQETAQQMGLNQLALDTENDSNPAYYAAQGYTQAGVAHQEPLTIYSMHRHL